jgi:prepilin-type N-terminal cleavage/methylation domain-containing protein
VHSSFYKNTNAPAAVPGTPGSCPARPEKTSRRFAVRAFTLLEVLLSIAILGLVAVVLIGGSAHLLTEKPTTATEVFWKAVLEARKTALKTEHDIRLKFDRDKKQFVLIDGFVPPALAADGFTLEETPLKQFQVPPTSAADLTVEFLPPATKGGGNTILVGGMLMEGQAIPYVTFYSDGTCSAFRTQMSRNGGTSMLLIDPWTCAPMLPTVDANGTPAI